MVNDCHFEYEYQPLRGLITGMASASEKDIGLLLAPISTESPAGVNLREVSSPSSPYYQLKDARGGARAAERRGDASDDASGLPQEWSTICKLAPRVLTEVSKDLEIAVWYVEALVRTEGLAGLSDGFRLLRGLVDEYWETMFSLEDEDGLVTRLAPLSGLNGLGGEGTLIQPLRRAPITDGDGGDAAYSAYHYQRAWEISQIADPAARARVEGREVTLDQFNKAVARTKTPFFLTLIDNVESCQKQWEALTTTLEARAGYDAPPSSNIRDLLATIRDTVGVISKDVVSRHQADAGATAEVSPEAASVPAVAESGGGAFANPIGAIRNREDALKFVLKASDYFRSNEPHSPIADTLVEVVRRARMPFAELLAELVPDDTTFRQALTIAGIKPPPLPGY